MTTSEHVQNINIFQNVPAFCDLDEPTLARILAVASRRSVSRGEVLIHEGAPADDLFIVLQGRFSVLAAGARPIAEIRVGEPIGELAFFAGGVRTATVVAARDSEVLVLSNEQYNQLSREVPVMDKTILASIAERLARVTVTSPKLRPRAGELVVVLPVPGYELPEGFGAKLADAMAAHSDWIVRYASEETALMSGDGHDVARRMAEIDAADGRTLIICDQGPDAASTSVQIAGHSDTVYLVGKQAESSDPLPLSDAERGLAGAMLKDHQHLVLVRDRSEAPIENTQAWLTGREVALHHHFALDAPEDAARLARFVTGNAVGLVLCGGGAFGTAHLGALKALQEHGHTVDMVGGTSVGAAIAAALALGYSPDEVMKLCEQIFVKSKAMSKLMVPLHSVIDHRKIDAALKEQFGDARIEDTPISYYSVATSLTKNDMHIARSGPLWQAVRASSSIPAVFPPMVTDEGEVLVDGAMFDNVPISAMRDLKPGPNLVLNFKQGREWRVKAKYADLPGRFEAFLRMFWRKRGRPRHPTIFSILTRAMIVSSRRQLEQTSMEGDILLEISTLKGMGFLDWTKGSRLFHKAYEDISAALSEAAKQSDDKTEQLRLVAAAINSKSSDAR
ncbi:patatin-like phospholipase family protein [Rhodobacteraceae bacterium D3-12]|nr:patatin-like phospholipase family protein [Rhodobacteraceae bacterium D3-12]